MSFVQLAGVNIAFGDRDILKEVNFSVRRGDRVALTGANGSGKTTLMRIIAGKQPPDRGSVHTPRGTRIAYLPQSGILHSGRSLYTEAERSFEWVVEYQRELNQIGRTLEAAKEQTDGTQRLLEQFHELQERIAESGYYSREATIEGVLMGLGFKRRDLPRDTREFSGGWQMRIALSSILLTNPDIMLLDEPTNYLDIEAREWLESYLMSFTGGVLLVSHDRFFLDSTMNQIAELFLGRLSVLKGNYSAYEKRRRDELASLLAAYDLQQEEVAKLEDFIRRFRYNASKAALVQSRVKQLEKIEPIEIPESMKPIHFHFPAPPHSGRNVIHGEAMGRSYQTPEGRRTVLSGVDIEIERGEKLVLVGPNGAGKSTLMRILAGRDNDYTGTLQFGSGVEVAYFAQDMSDSLDESVTVFDEIEKAAPTSLYPQLRGMLGSFLFRGDDIFKKVAVLSGGERSRVALLKMILKPANLLILDEPTNHLDMSSKDVLLDALKQFTGTIIFVSHDRYFIERLATRVVELIPDASEQEASIVTNFPGDYAYYLFRRSAAAGAPVEQSEQSSALGERQPGNRDNFEVDKRKKNAIRKLKREEEEILASVEKIESDQKRLQHELALPEVYVDGERVRNIKEQLAARAAEHEALLLRWETVSQELAGAERG